MRDAMSLRNIPEDRAIVHMSEYRKDRKRLVSLPFSYNATLPVPETDVLCGHLQRVVVLAYVIHTVGLPLT